MSTSEKHQTGNDQILHLITCEQTAEHVNGHTPVSRTRFVFSSQRCGNYGASGRPFLDFFYVTVTPSGSVAQQQEHRCDTRVDAVK